MNKDCILARTPGATPAMLCHRLGVATKQVLACCPAPSGCGPAAKCNLHKLTGPNTSIAVPQELGRPSVNLGIYLHIPFCQSKCHYCHFLTVPYHAETAERYERTVTKELEVFSSTCEKEKVDSIYFGGGTPSLVPSRVIINLISECRRHYSLTDDCEISLEANPGTITREKAADFYHAGVNRISMGAQSFDDLELESIGRIHSAEMINESLHRLRNAGLSNINLDLMLGLPRQTAKSWKLNLERIIELGPPHLSVYMLDLDDQCPLHSMLAKGSIQIPDEDLVSDLYLETIEYLSSLGYQQYEISNFARPGFSCRHNLKYWMRAPVQGFGLGSHSFDGCARYANNTRIDEYIQAIENGRSPEIWREPVSAEQAIEETLFLGLRLKNGVNWNQLRDRCPQDRRDAYEKAFKWFSDKGWIEWQDSTICLTPLGMLFSNEVFQFFV
jgi:oxygen-independent coproporphyrinogen III oxidase